MSEFNRKVAEIIAKQARQQIIDQTSKMLEQRFASRIHDMQIYARIFYASILSSYIRANSFGNKVGLIVPELEPLTKALYAISSKKRNKIGSFETSKAFQVSNNLVIRYRNPLGIKGDTFTYRLTFIVTHPLLTALENGEVSWDNMERTKILGILKAALITMKKRQGRGKGKISKSAGTSIEKQLTKAIKQLSGSGSKGGKRYKGGVGRFKIVHNKRPYMEIAVKNIIQQKDFINILIK